MATATIPETVTLPSAVVLDAIADLHAVGSLHAYISAAATGKGLADTDVQQWAFARAADLMVDAFGVPRDEDADDWPVYRAIDGRDDEKVAELLELHANDVGAGFRDIAWHMRQQEARDAA